MSNEKVIVGDQWRHSNKCIYTVTDITNEDSVSPTKYPVTVVYSGSNGKKWSRVLDDWHRSMTLHCPKRLTGLLNMILEDCNGRSGLAISNMESKDVFEKAFHKQCVELSRLGTIKANTVKGNQVQWVVFN